MKEFTCERKNIACERKQRLIGPIRPWATKTLALLTAFSGAKWIRYGGGGSDGGVIQGLTRCFLEKLALNYGHWTKHIQYVTAEWKQAFLSQAREFLFFPLLPTWGGKQVSSYFWQRNWVQAREAQIRFPAGWLEFDSIEWSSCANQRAPRSFVIYDPQFSLASSKFSRESIQYRVGKTHCQGHQDPSKSFPIFPGTQEANVKMVSIKPVPIPSWRTVGYYTVPVTAWKWLAAVAVSFIKMVWPIIREGNVRPCPGPGAVVVDCTAAGTVAAAPLLVLVCYNSSILYSSFSNF